MNAETLVTDVLVIIHLLGVTIVVGSFFSQLLSQSGYRFVFMRTGAMTLFASGGALVGSHELCHLDLNLTKIGVKAGVAFVVLAAVVVARIRQRRLLAAGQTDSALRPFVYVAGLLAIADVAIAVTWA